MTKTMAPENADQVEGSPLMARVGTGPAVPCFFFFFFRPGVQRLSVQTVYP